MTAHRDYLLTRESLPLLLRLVAQEHGTTVAMLTGHRRPSVLVQARREFIRRAYDTGASLSRIGTVLNRDHTTILHHLRVMGLV